MKIAIIVYSFPKISETFIIRLVESLADSGVTVDIIVTGFYDSDLLERMSYRVRNLIDAGSINLVYHKGWPDIKPKIDLVRNTYRAHLKIFGKVLMPLGVRMYVTELNEAREAFRLRSLVDIRNYDIVHAQYLPLAVIAAKSISSSRSATKLLGYIRGADISVKSAIVDRHVRYLTQRPFFSGITSVSESLKKKAIHRGFREESIFVVRSGVNINDLPFMLPSLKNNQRLQVVQIGRFVEKKGHQLSFDMLSRVEHIDFDFHVIGGGALYDKFRQTHAEFFARSNVILHGPLAFPEVQKILNNSDIVIMPSHTAVNGDSEGIPNVLKEAMALGTICIASRHSGIPELIEDNKSGFLFNEADAIDFRKKFLIALDSRNHWDQIAIQARKVVEDRFNQVKISNDMLELYRKLSILKPSI
jgi:colanic acid/amylovoran biosynthesis glycosyltransferase